MVRGHPAGEAVVDLRRTGVAFRHLPQAPRVGVLAGIAILVHVDEGEDTARGELLLRGLQRSQVAVVTDAGLRFERGMYHAKPHAVETLTRKAVHLLCAKTHCGRRVRRMLDDHVYPVNDFDTPLGVHEPASHVADPGSRACFHGAG